MGYFKMNEYIKIGFIKVFRTFLDWQWFQKPCFICRKAGVFCKGGVSVYAGYIKIHRQLLEWEWYGDTNTMACFSPPSVVGELEKWDV